MGIPKFYRWLSERYPLLNQPLTATEAPPQFDNLYLDMNGIIHNCTHGNDPTLKITEEEMIVRIFAYLEKLIQIIKPQNLVFMAIDGVAPRAKMNQQRSRRFKTGMEREKAKADEAAKALREGTKLPEGESFDSNCITPGTGFMGRLGEHLRFFIRKKVAEDVVWQKPKVIFSGHDVPGEGEHKIMEYIRLEQRSGEMPANSRHCMYGLDADLIMLSLVTHEPHFCLLREVVSYTGRNRGQPTREALENPAAEHFVLFQVGLLREYLELEFQMLTLPFALDVERVIDDFVLFCMLIGNDFLPALPTLDISEGALNKLIDMYKELLPGQGGYLTHAGALDRVRFELLIGRLGQLELTTLQERADDAEQFERKRSRRPAGNGRPNTNGAPPPAPRANGDDSLMGALEEEPPAAAAPAGPTMMSQEARRIIHSDGGLEAWKERYYVDKLEVHGREGRRKVVEEYVRGLHWVLEYYYRGVASWEWFYPYHYAPMASDLNSLDAVEVVFSQGKPFKPFEQLLSVLPATSSWCLPDPFKWLMTDPASPIIDFYPIDFEVDMEGKRADWEGIAKICFVDQQRLLAAAALIKPEQLTKEERHRNENGYILLFTASKNPTGEQEFCTSTLPHRFSSVVSCNSKCRKMAPPPPLPAGQPGFRPQIPANSNTGLSAPAGFPTLKTMGVTGELKMVGINVFGSASKKDSLVIGLKDLRTALGLPPPARNVAGSVVGERCYVNWPYLREAMVVAVSDAQEKVKKDGSAAHTAEAAKEWGCTAAALANTFMTKQGIDVGKCDLLLHVKDCIGHIRHVDDTVEKKFAEEEALYPLQAVLRRHPAHGTAAAAATASSDDPTRPTLKLEEGAKVLFLGRTHYGCMGVLLQDPGQGLTREGRRVAAAKANYRWRVQLQLPADSGVDMGLVARRALKAHSTKYIPSGEAGRKAGMGSRTLGRITGNLWISDGDSRWDVGLAVKDSRNGLCVPGYSEPESHGGMGWRYSPALITCLQQYRSTHPWVFRMLEDQPETGSYRLEAALPDKTGEERKAMVEAVQKWVKSLPMAKRRLVKAGAQVASDEACRVIVASLPPVGKPPPPIELENVPPMLLLPPAEAGQLQSVLVGGMVEVGDRVVCLKAAGGPPFGARGTVIGAYDDSAEVLMDEPFSAGSDLQGRLGNCRQGAHLPLKTLLPINFAAPIRLQKGMIPVEVPLSQPNAWTARATGTAEPPPAAAAAAAAAVAGPAAVVPQAAAAAVAAASAALPSAQPPTTAPTTSPPSAASTHLANLLRNINFAKPSNVLPVPLPSQTQTAPTQPKQHLPAPAPTSTPSAPIPIPAPNAPHAPPISPSPPQPYVIPMAAAPRTPTSTGAPSAPLAVPSASAAAAKADGPPVPKFLLERAQQRQAAAGATVAPAAAAAEAKPAPRGHVPRMPDGTRGFAVGRGRPMPNVVTPSTTPPMSPGALPSPTSLLYTLSPRLTPPPSGASTPPPTSPAPIAPAAAVPQPAAGRALLMQLQAAATAPRAAPPQPTQQAAAAVAAAQPPAVVATAVAAVAAPPAAVAAAVTVALQPAPIPPQQRQATAPPPAAAVNPGLMLLSQLQRGTPQQQPSTGAPPQQPGAIPMSPPRLPVQPQQPAMSPPPASTMRPAGSSPPLSPTPFNAAGLPPSVSAGAPVAAGQAAGRQLLSLLSGSLQPPTPSGPKPLQATNNPGPVPPSHQSPTAAPPPVSVPASNTHSASDMKELLALLQGNQAGGHPGPHPAAPPPSLPSPPGMIHPPNHMPMFAGMPPPPLHQMLNGPPPGVMMMPPPMPAGVPVGMFPPGMGPPHPHVLHAPGFPVPHAPTPQGPPLVPAPAPGAAFNPGQMLLSRLQKRDA